MLTYQSDRLPALAALAEQSMKLRHPNDRYLAGLWEKTLWLDLQWFRADVAGDREGSLYPGRRVAQSRLPSWSWASIDVRVLWKNRNLSPGFIPSSVEIIAIDRESRGSPVMGDYKTCQLTLRAPLIGITLPTLSNPFTTDGKMGALIGEHIPVEWFQPDYQLDVPGPGHVVPESAVFILSLAVVDHGHLLFCHCLVLLEKFGSGTLPCYERIGFVRLIDLIQQEEFVKQDFYDGHLEDSKKRFEKFFSSLPRLEIVLI